MLIYSYSEFMKIDDRLYHVRFVIDMHQSGKLFPRILVLAAVQSAIFIPKLMSLNTKVIFLPSDYVR